MKPVTEIIQGVCVVRDDLYEGGTKARIFEYLYSQYDEVIYACAAFSKTQVALARVAKKLGKTATIFLPKRQKMTKETQAALALNAQVREVKPGYMTVVQKRAREWWTLGYVKQQSIYLAPLGFDTPNIIRMLADVAKQVDFAPTEVWCAAGSGTLTRSLQLAWPTARHCAVQVGKNCNVGGAVKFEYPKPLEWEYKGEVPFPADRQYEAKAWEICMEKRDPNKKTLFWNVTGG